MQKSPLGTIYRQMSRDMDELLKETVDHYTPATILGKNSYDTLQRAIKLQHTKDVVNHIRDRLISYANQV